MTDMFTQAGVVPATGCPHYITATRAAGLKHPTRCRRCVIRPTVRRPRDLRMDARGNRA